VLYARERGGEEVNCPNRNCFINSPSKRGRTEGGKRDRGMRERKGGSHRVADGQRTE